MSQTPFTMRMSPSLVQFTKVSILLITKTTTGLWSVLATTPWLHSLGIAQVRHVTRHSSVNLGKWFVFTAKKKFTSQCPFIFEEAQSSLDLWNVVKLTDIKHGSKRWTILHTSFSYTRCSVQCRIWTLRRTVPSRTEVTRLNCSDHSTSLKKLAS